MKKAVVAVLLFAATTLHAGSTITASSAALATASPYATSVGLSVLRRGGNAIDAAVAVAFTLAVVHPQGGNIGGGGFLVYYDAASKGMWTLDFRECASLAANAKMFASAGDARIGAQSAAVPGTVAGLAAAHKRFGSLPWKELMAPAIAIAREGLRVDPELNADLAAESRARKIEQFPSTAAIFFPEGKPLAPGGKLSQTDLASTLERIATSGPSDFYTGETAKRIVQAAHANHGTISFRDLKSYAPVWRAPLKIAFGAYEIYTVPPPSAGGVVVAEALNILSGYDLAAAGFQAARAIHLQTEAERRAFIDAANYVGDPSVLRIPYRDILSSQRAALWRNSLDLARATPTSTLAPVTPAAERQHTTHFTIVDQAGNIVSLTTSLGDRFGSGFVVPGCGFFLNSAMGDFTSGTLNSIEPSKRPLSFATPIIVMRNGKPLLAAGTRGGGNIPAIVLQLFLNVTTYGKSLTDAVAAPRYNQQANGEDIVYETGLSSRPLLDSLIAMGHGIRAAEIPGDVQAIMIDGDRLIAVADPRRGGAAGGY